MRILTGVVRAGAIAIDDPEPLRDGDRVTVVVEDDEDDDDDRATTGRTLDEMPVVDLAVRDENITIDEIAIGPCPDPASEPTVLVVEDDPDLGEVFSEVIGAAGYKVERARDGREALRVLRDGRPRPHLILLDMRMPNMDGEQFRRAQEQDAELADIPVVVTSADGNIGETVAELDVAAFLPKPVNRSELVSTISRLCDDDDDDDLGNR